MRFASAPLLLTCLLSAPAQTPGAPAAPAAPASAATDGSAAVGSATAGAPSAGAPTATYKNDVLHLAYSYPSGYTDATALVGPAIQASLSGDPASAAQAACLSVPFSRMDSSSGQMGMVLLVRADSACLKKKFTAKSVSEAAQDEARSLAASGAKTSFGPLVPYDVAGHPAALLLGSFALPTGQSMQAMVSCVLDQPDIACWQFLATTTDRLRLMSSFPVSFNNGPATPLVPTNILTKP